MPKELKGNTIYVQFTEENERVFIEALSIKEFNYHTHSLSGKEQTRQGTQACNEDGGVSSSHYRDVDEFLKDLITSNQGEIDYSRLIAEGAVVRKKMLGLAQFLDGK